MQLKLFAAEHNLMFPKMLASLFVTYWIVNIYAGKIKVLCNFDYDESYLKEQEHVKDNKP